MRAEKLQTALPKSFHAKLILDCIMINIIRMEDGGREVRMIGRIWKMLRLHHECATVRIDHAIFANDGAVQKVAGIKLQARFRGPDFKDAAVVWIGHPGVQPEFAHLVIDDKVVVVTAGKL